METLTALLLIAIISYVSNRITPVLVRLPIGAQHVLFTGTEYLFLGLLLGPYLIGFLSKEVLDQLRPFVSLALGWIGLLYGLQFNWRDIRTFPLIYMPIAFLQALITMGIVFIVFYPVLGYLLGGNRLLYPLLIALSASASLTSPSAIAVLHRRVEIKERDLVTLVRYISGIDSLIGITIFGLTFAIFHITYGYNQGLLPLEWFLLTIGLSLFLAMIFNLCLLLPLTSNEFLAVTTGMVVFSSGVASFLYLSPLFVSMVMGLIIANTSSKREILYENLVRGERPFYIIFVIIVGGLWTVEPLWGGIGALIYTLARVAGKYLGGIYATAIFKPPFPIPRDLGLALLSQGGVAIAIAASLQQTYQTTLTPTVMTIILTGVIINEFLGPRYLMKVLSK